MTKRTRAAIAMSLIYELVVFCGLDEARVLDEPTYWIFWSIPVIAYWLYKFVKSGE